MRDIRPSAKHNILTVHINPNSHPFHAKALPGIHGNKIGVKTQPVITVPIYA